MFDSIVNFIQQGGYAGIVALMFLENLFPPIPPPNSSCLWQALKRRRDK